MSIAQILSKAQSLGVRLRIEGDIVKMKGPADAIAAIKTEIAAHKPEIMAHLVAAANDPEQLPDECAGALRDAKTGAPYFPWGPYLTPEMLKAWQRELLSVVDELAKLECWHDDIYDIVVQTIERQPISTLRPDFAYFQSRLEAARAEKAARDALSRRSWRFDR